MENIKCEVADGILVITLARGKANALDWKMIEELTGALAQARSDSTTRGLVIASASARFFSGGFDVAEVFGYSREKMGEFFGRFIDLYESLYRLPKPVVAAIGGHAYARGGGRGFTGGYPGNGGGGQGFCAEQKNLVGGGPPVGDL